MSVATPSDVRDITGLSPEEADDDKIQGYIDKAYRRFLNDVGIYAIDDVLTGDIDGTNTTFSVNYVPIADRDFDGVAGSLDVEVCQWLTENDLSTKSTLTVSNVNSKYGVITLSSAPSSDADELTASYYYYPRHIPESLIIDAVSALAGYLYVLQEFLLIPERLGHGAYRWTHVKPYMPLWNEYQQIKSMIVATLAYKGTNDNIQNARDEVDDI
jgi:hypothetical protein